MFLDDKQVILKPKNWRRKNGYMGIYKNKKTIERNSLSKSLTLYQSWVLEAEKTAPERVYEANEKLFLG